MAGIRLGGDARPLTADQTVLSGLYHAGLRSELTRSLGVDWKVPANGIAEMLGVDGEVLGEFSRRSSQVGARQEVKLERFRAAFGREPTSGERWRLDREAVVESRRSKPATHAAAELRAGWPERLEGHRTDAGRLAAATVGRVVEPSPDLDSDPWGLMADAALAALTETQSTRRHPDVVRELARAVPTDTGMPRQPRRGSGARRRRGRRGVAHRAGPPVRAEEWLRETDGRPVTESPLERRYTTAYILEQEQHLARWAQARWSQPARPASLEAAGMDRAQHAAAQTVAGDAAIVVVVGPAGTGKTTALRLAMKSLTAAGRPVSQRRQPLPPPGSSARRPVWRQTDRQAPHRGGRYGPRPPFQLPDGTTLIVDEAAMVPTATLAELANLADGHRWRVVLVGDPLQHAADGWGGMFDWLIEHGPAIELDRVHRFTHPWERHASLRLRRGDPDALDLYRHHGRLHRAEPDEADFDLLDHWCHLRRHGHSVAVIAADNDTVGRLNTLAQQARIDAGELNAAGPNVATDGGYRLLVGDEIATRRNDRRLRTDRGDMVRNRDHWTIAGIGRHGDIAAHGPTGTVHLPADYVAARRTRLRANRARRPRPRCRPLLAPGRHRRRQPRHVRPPYPGPAVEPRLCRPRSRRPAQPSRCPRRSRQPGLGETRAIVRRRQHASTRATAPVDAARTAQVAEQLRHIDDLNVPFHRGELPRHQALADQAAHAHHEALAAREAARATTDRSSAELQALDPWRPFSGRRRAELEAVNRAANRQLANAGYRVETTSADLERSNERLDYAHQWLARYEPDHRQRAGLAAALERDLDARTVNATTTRHPAGPSTPSAAARPLPRPGRHLGPHRRRNSQCCDIW